MTTLSPELRAMLTLHLIPGLGPRKTAGLLERFGSAVAALQAPTHEVRKVPHIGDALAAAIASARTSPDVEKELQLLDRHHTRILTLGAPEYPPVLATIRDAPPVLYVRGTLEERDGNAVAIVGSRTCTAYGKRLAERLAGDLARAGFTVVSGLARGIDGVAHRAALAAGGRTIAVLANGLSRIYPPEHADLAAQIETAGALLSEAPMGQGPLPELFPPRNRIISGLSRATIIVEADVKSGALITGREAAEQGRTVFAVPGPVDSASSSGCNALIREGAILCRGVDDVLEELQGISAMATAKKEAAARPATPPPTLDETQRRIWDFLAEKPRHLDEMVQGLGMSVSQLAGVLLGLEMQNVVRRLPGNRYERC